MPATGAEPIEFESVSLNDEAVLGGDLLLQAFDLAILELYNSSTAGADEVVVMALVGNIVVLRLGAEMAGLGNPRFAEQIQGAIDGGQSQVWIFFGELVIHGLRRDVLLPKKCRQDQLALAGELELMLRQVVAEHVHFFNGFSHGAWISKNEAH
jgi:hypothetical protein